MASSKTIHIQFISDFICPWCYIGKIRLERLKEKLIGEINLDIELVPFVLYPQIPSGGLPKSAFSKRTKPGMGKSLKQEAQKEGVEINYKNIERIPYSLEAHRLIQLVEDNATKFELAKQIFISYFEKGQDIEDLDYLVSLGKSIGMSKSILSEFLFTNLGEKELNTALKRVKEEFVTVVPSLKLDRKIILPGLQPFDVWENYIRRAAEIQ
ncbi:DsbA family protein [Saprospiraceae bacterium]|jgi:predicted DsbA family dithiol-disulfide isomerase|nr:DsbA family protein [Bacteroidota bacterium]MDB4727482.1 DsbA family protein [Saprospiraceae bacterium]MDF1863673.1 DsbA family protein [Saprospiraceae bacterium]